MKVKIVDVSTGKVIGQGLVSSPAAARQAAQNFVAEKNLPYDVSAHDVKVAFDEAKMDGEGEIILKGTVYSMYLQR